MRVYTAIVVLLIGSLICSPQASAERASKTKLRYLVHSESKSLKREVGARHKFGKAFSANMSRAEAKALRVKGLKLTRVRKTRLLRPDKCSPWPACKNSPDPTPTPGSRAYYPSDQTPWGIEAIYNNSSISASSGGVGVKVAVLDSGADTDHPDLSANIKGCVDFTGKGRHAIREGRCADDDGHGTHVAGTVAGNGGADGQGIYGVAPDADLLIYRVCKPSGCWNDDIAAAINYAGSRANIVSMSLGADGESSLIRDAIAGNLNLLFVAASGNDGPSAGSIDFPGANVNVMAVAALDSNLNVADFSSRGINDSDTVIEYREVEVAAPGVGVESTFLNGSYAVGDGTSMATPHIAGLAAREWKGSAAATRSHLQAQALANDIGAAGVDNASGLGFPLTTP